MLYPFTMSDHRLSTDPEAVATRGEAIYTERYRAQFERDYPGQFVAIDIVTDAAYRGLTPEAALTLAREGSPQGIFHLIRIGEPGAFRVSYTSASRRHRISA